MANIKPYTLMKVFRIIPEFRNLRLTFHRNFELSHSKTSAIKICQLHIIGGGEGLYIVIHSRWNIA